MSLPKELYRIRAQVEGHARDFGLDFFDTIFEVLDYQKMNEVASYGGFPTRYPHWRWGMEYESLSKGHTYGLQRIYEMVINNDPAYAYLLEGNSLVEQKMVMAHVFGHVDFFKNNYYFSKTHRKVVDSMANHATRVRRHIERHGAERVESFIDVCLSLDNLIDPLSPFIQRRATHRAPGKGAGADPGAVLKLRAKPYMDKYINPPEFLEEQRKRIDQDGQRARTIPEEPQRDVMLFLLEHAPLEHWERDVLEIVRDEAYYFAPQIQTKIMNEGWASYWHSRIMTEKAADDSDFIAYARAASGVTQMSGGQINPYKLGIELLRHIKDRWDKGRFGREWEECDDYDARRNWDKRLGLGTQKIFEVRRHYNDVTFIDEFLTEEFCREQRLFTFAWNERGAGYEIQSREFQKIKQKLLFQLTNFGQPFIYVEDANFENRAELLLRHHHEGLDLRMDQAQDTLANVQRVWRRPVNLLTLLDGKGKILRFDGSEHSEKATDYPSK